MLENIEVSVYTQPSRNITPLNPFFGLTKDSLQTVGEICFDCYT